MSLYVDFFHLLKKHAEENDLMHETSPTIVVIVVLKSKNRMIWRYLLIFTLTIANDYP